MSATKEMKKIYTTGYGTRRLMPESCMLKDLSKLIFYSSSQLTIYIPKAENLLMTFPKFWQM